jgi:RNA polymerase sigma factor for flagellar operon FliA
MMTSEKRSAPRQQELTGQTRDRIVLENLSLVKAIAVRVRANLPVHVDMDDLVHAGMMGLFDAVSKYNPETKVVFQSYAKHRIRGAILDSLRQADWASRDSTTGDCAQSERAAGIRGGPVALDRGAHLRLAGALSTAQVGLRALAGDYRGQHSHRHDSANAT